MAVNPNLIWMVVRVEDFNGDGKTDILVRNKINGNYWLYSMNGYEIVSQGWVRANPNLTWKMQSNGATRNPCEIERVYDCVGNCAEQTFLGDVICDDGTTYDEEGIDFQCSPFDYDAGDCY